MSAASLQRAAARSVASQMHKDKLAERCTVLTEMIELKWRIHACGPRMKDGELQVLTFVKEYETLEEMLKSLPGVMAGFYSVGSPVEKSKQSEN